MAPSTNPLRVHIAPVGFEVQRVTEPLVRLRADRAYLVSFTLQDAAKAQWAEVHKTLQREYKSIEVRDIFTNIWDLNAVLQTYGGLIRGESAHGNLIFANVSTGTKITAIAGLLSSMFWGTTAYYAQTSYGEGTPSIQDIRFLPALRFDVLPKRERQTLVAIKRQSRPVSKEELIRILREGELIPGVSKISPAATYRRLDTILGPLLGRGFVEITGQRRAARVQLTEQGRAALLLLEQLA
jgi:hypothetical protein